MVMLGKNRKVGHFKAPSMLVGFSCEHDEDCYPLWKSKIEQVTKMRDVIWLKESFFGNRITFKCSVNW